MVGLGGALSRVSPRFTTLLSGAAWGGDSGSPKGLRSRGGGRGGVAGGCGEAADGSKSAKFVVSMLAVTEVVCCIVADSNLSFFLFDCAAFCLTLIPSLRQGCT